MRARMSEYVFGNGYTMIKKLCGSNFIQLALLTLAVVLGMLWPFYPLEHLESRYHDLWAGWFTTGENPPMAMVAIDDKSLRAIGAWPWPRSLVARTIEHLSDAGAQTLGVMLLYSHKSLNPGLEEIQNLQEIAKERKQPSGKSSSEIPDAAFAAAEKRLDQDAQLISAVKSANNVILPFRFAHTAPPPGGNNRLSGMLVINSLKIEDDTTAAGRRIEPLGEWIRKRSHANGVARPIREPYKELAGKAGAIGHLNLIIDPDGIVRRIPLLIEYNGRLLPSFALQTVIKHKLGNLKKIKLDQGILQIADLDIPIDSSYRMLFHAPPDRPEIKTYSFVDVMNGTVDTKGFKNSLVLLGVTGGEYARFYRPAAGNEISETALFSGIIAGMLSPRHISRPEWALTMEIMAVLYFSVFLMVVIPRVNLTTGGLILGIFLVSWAGISMALFWMNGYWIKIFAPFILAGCGYGLVGLKSIAREKRNVRLEADKTLGLSFQEQGMLDMALEKFMLCPIADRSVKNALYHLGLDFQRKRMNHKALAVYERIQKAGNFKDLKKRIEKLKKGDNSLAMSTTNGIGGIALSIDDTHTHPTLGRYEILKELGRGAMGTVFLGRDPRINREVAVKTLPYAEIETHELDEVKSRFFREAEAAGRLSHPNIVSIHDAGEEHDMAYIAMELLEGRELSEYCSSGNLLPVEKVLGIILSVATALEYAHNEGVVHRDIKPSNIMIVKDDRVKVTDFGIARVIDASRTRTGIALGTPSYMSPEQVAGKKVDGRSDLFSLGIVFYQLLTGKKPFEADSITAVLYAITHSAYPPLSAKARKIPACCVKIVDKLLKKGLTARFNSASQVIKAIEACRNEC